MITVYNLPEHELLLRGRDLTKLIAEKPISLWDKGLVASCVFQLHESAFRELVSASCPVFLWEIIMISQTGEKLNSNKIFNAIASWRGFHIGSTNLFALMS